MVVIAVSSTFLNLTYLTSFKNAIFNAHEPLASSVFLLSWYATLMTVSNFWWEKNLLSRKVVDNDKQHTPTIFFQSIDLIKSKKSRETKRKSKEAVNKT